MNEREPSQVKSKASPSGVNLARPAKIAALVFFLLVAAIAITALMTDGSPDVPFDYGGFE